MNKMLFRKGVDVLLLMGSYPNSSKSDLAKGANLTYSHTVKLLKCFEKDGLVVFNKVGRRQVCSLTEKGNNTVIHLSAIKQEG